MFQPLKKYLQSRSKVIELYIVVKSTEAYNRVLVYCAENGIRLTDSRTAFGDVNSERIEYFDVPDKRIASFMTLELSGKFEHLKLMEEIADIVGVIYVEEVSWYRINKGAVILVPLFFRLKITQDYFQCIKVYINEGV